MREIKFRAWEERSKTMLFGVSTGTHLISSNTTGYQTESKHCIFQQYTGLKDKNGKEIYEGDIIKINNDDDFIEKVEWVDENNWNDTKCPVNGWVNHQSIYKKPIEVIGNIYENPELINKREPKQDS